MSWVLAGVSVATAVGGAAYSSSQAKKAQSKADAQAKKDSAAAAKRSKSIKSSSSGMEAMEAPQINLLQMGRDALQLQRESYPQQLELQRQYGADFARADVDTANARARAEMAGIEANGAAFNRSLRGASPEIDAATRGITNSLGELGASDIEREQQRQALVDLRLGGQLSAEEARTANQAARAAFGARGLNRGNPAAFGEVLNREQYSNARRDQRRSYASSVDGQQINRRTTDAAIANNAQNTLGSFYDPQMRLFGRGGSAVSGQVSGPGQGMPYLQTAGNIATANLSAQSQFQSLMQDDYQFGVNREDSNYWSGINMAATNRNAQAQLSASNTNGMLSAAGTAAGMFASAYARR